LPTPILTPNALEQLLELPVLRRIEVRIGRVHHCDRVTHRADRLEAALFMGELREDRQSAAQGHRVRAHAKPDRRRDDRPKAGCAPAHGACRQASRDEMRGKFGGLWCHVGGQAGSQPH